MESHRVLLWIYWQVRRFSSIIEFGSLLKEKDGGSVQVFCLSKSTRKSRQNNWIAKPKIPGQHLPQSWLMSYPMHTAIQAGGDKPLTAKDVQGPNFCREGHRVHRQGGIWGT